MSFLDGLFAGDGEGGDPLAISDVILSGSGAIGVGFMHLVQGADTNTVLTLVAAAVEDVAGKRFAVKVTSPAPTPPGGELIVTMPPGMMIEGDDGLFAESASLVGRQDAGNYREWKCDEDGTWHMLAGGFGDVAPHVAAHEAGGADELDVTGLTGQLSDPQTVAVGAGGVVVGARPEINFKAGGGVSIGVAEDGAADRMDVTVNVIARGLVISDQPMVMAPGIESAPATVSPDHVYQAIRTGGIPTLLTVAAGLVPADTHGHRIGIFTVGGTVTGNASLLAPGSDTALIQDPHALTGAAVSIVTLPYVGYSEWVFDQDGNDGAGLWRVLTWIEDAVWVARALREAGGAALAVGAVAAGAILHRVSTGQATLVGGPALMDEAGNITGAGTINGVSISAHKARHQDGGADELNVAGLSGALADPQIANKIVEGGQSVTLPVGAIPVSGIMRRSVTGQVVGGPALMDDAGNVTGIGTINGAAPAAHAARHQDGGADEISVAGLSGVLADPQTAGGLKTQTTTVAVAGSAAPTPGQVLVAGGGTVAVWAAAPTTAHKTLHQDGGADEINVAGLSGRLADPQPVTVMSNAGVAGTRPQIYFAPGFQTTVTATDDPANNRVNVVVNANVPQGVHAESHANGGADEINVAGLSGVLADPQTAGGIKTATGIVVVGSAAAPSLGQILIATSSSGATWQNPLSLTLNNPSSIDASAVAAAGVATDAARRDHVHALLPAVAPQAVVAGGGNTAGSSQILARADHVHGMQAFGSAAGTFCQGNDARLSDVRTPTLHAASHKPGGADTVFNGSFVQQDVPGWGIANFNPRFLGMRSQLFANVAVTSTSYVSIPSFDIAIPRNAVYYFDFMILYTTDNVSEGIGLQMFFNGAGNLSYCVDAFTSLSTRAPLLMAFGLNAGLAAQSAGPGLGVTVPVFIRGALQVSTIGTLSVQARAKTATIPVTIATLSHGRVFSE